MDYLKRLESYIRSIGWYGGRLIMTITTEGGFEAFSGRATETWEYRTVIEINGVKGSRENIIVPMLRVVGDRSESIDEVAKKVLKELEVIV